MDFRRFLADLGGPRWGPDNRVVAARVDSTNRLARRIASAYLEEESLPPDTVVLAFEQTAGRGRLGRSWESPRGRGVYATRLLVVPGAPPGGRSGREVLEALPLAAALGLAGGVDRLLAAAVGEIGEVEASPRCRLKWPNDLLLAPLGEAQGADGEGGDGPPALPTTKVGGVLIETLPGPEGATVVLLGFGVNHGHGREELPTPGAISLRLAVEASSHALAEGLPSLGASARQLVRHLDLALEEVTGGGDGARPLPTAQLARRYRERSVHRPGQRLTCRVASRVVRGELVRFDDRGHLHLRTDEGAVVVMASGEILEPSEEG